MLDKCVLLPSECY